MKKYGLRMATAVFGLVVFGAGAKAQDRDQLVVNIPFPFVASGKTLPAGTYHLSRLSRSNVNELILRSVENHDGVFVLSTEWEDARDAKPGVTLQEIDGQRFLSRIETAEHVFTIALSKSAALAAAVKPSQDFTASGAK